MSNRFARSGEDKFADLVWSEGETGSPLLDEYAALFECRTRHLYEGGDHIILVGEVPHFQSRKTAPLLFHGGAYAEHRSRPAGPRADTVDLDTGRFTDDFLFYLIARAYFQTSAPTRKASTELGLSQAEYLVLAALSMATPVSTEILQSRLAHTGHAPTAAMLATMAARGLLSIEGGSYDIGPAGRDALIRTLAVGQAFEADIADHLTRGELAEAKWLLRKIIDLTGQNVPLAWRS